MKVHPKVILDAFPIEETETWKTMSPGLQEINAGRMVVEHLPVHGEPGLVHIWKKEDFEREFEVLRDPSTVGAVMEEAFESKVKEPEGRRNLAKYAAAYIRDSIRFGTIKGDVVMGLIQRILEAIGEEGA